MGSIEELAMNSKGRYILRQANAREEMDAIMDVIWAANYTPYDPITQVFFPVLGYLPSHREAAVAESKDRFWKEHQSSPASNWYYVQEIGSGQVVGCAQWHVHLQNPFPDGPPRIRAPWWPEGQHREFCELILNQVFKPRASWMARPHLALSWMAVHPLHRRRGAGSLLMQVGINRADQLDLEVWLEASSMGKLLYENFGFRVLFKIAFDTQKEDADGQWRKLEHEMTPPAYSMMWRPKQGVWETASGGLVTMPWDLGKALS